MRKINIEDDVIKLQVRINAKPTLDKFPDEAIRKLVEVLEKNMSKNM